MSEMYRSWGENISAAMIGAAAVALAALLMYWITGPTAEEMRLFIQAEIVREKSTILEKIDELLRLSGKRESEVNALEEKLRELQAKVERINWTLETLDIEAKKKGTPIPP